jgi:hypothetical protein
MSPMMNVAWKVKMERALLFLGKLFFHGFQILGHGWMIIVGVAERNFRGGTVEVASKWRAF